MLSKQAVQSIKSMREIISDASSILHALDGELRIGDSAVTNGILSEEDWASGVIAFLRMGSPNKSEGTLWLDQALVVHRGMEQLLDALTAQYPNSERRSVQDIQDERRGRLKEVRAHLSTEPGGLQ